MSYVPNNREEVHSRGRDGCRSLQNCNDTEMAYSRSHNSNAPVIITGKTLTVENEDMTCGEIRQMVSKPIAISLEQAENAKRAGLNQNSNSSMVTLKSGEQIPRTCSFVETGEGFMEQYWYNCYTCGLLWDKVCSILRRLLFMFHVFSIVLSSYIFIRDVVRYVPEFAIRVMTLDTHVNHRSSVTEVPKWQLLLPKDEICGGSLLLSK